MVVKSCFPDDFYCTGEVRNPWYHFNGTQYVRMDSTLELMEYTNEKFVPLISKEQAEIINATKDSLGFTKWPTEIAGMSKLIEKLSRQSFKNALIKELKIYYMSK